MESAVKGRCRSCQRDIHLLPDGDLAFHYYIGSGVGIQCNGEQAPMHCRICREAKGMTELGVMVEHEEHHPTLDRVVRCAGSGQLPRLPM